MAVDLDQAAKTATVTYDLPDHATFEMPAVFSVESAIFGSFTLNRTSLKIKRNSVLGIADSGKCSIAKTKRAF